MSSDIHGTLASGEPWRALVILPAQYFIPAQKTAPEQQLMIAVLEDAVWCIQKYRAATDPAGRRLFLDARHWLLVSEPQWPYSFECICAALDLDTGALLHRLRLAPRAAVSSARVMPARSTGASRRAAPTLPARAPMRMAGAQGTGSGRS